MSEGLSQTIIIIWVPNESNQAKNSKSSNIIAGNSSISK
jgi:hypothetical protein